MKLPQQTWRDLITTATWRCTSTGDHHVLHVFEKQFMHVVETPLINGLSQQLIRRLGSVGFKSRHVQVVNKEKHAFARGRAQKILPLLL